MCAYHHVLLAVDFQPGVEDVCQRAREMTRAGSSRLSVIHVIEPMVMTPPYEGMSPLPVEFEQQMLQSARDSLQQLLDRVGLADAQWTVEVGAIKWTIVGYAKEQQVDLIVIGSHSRHGLERLLGSTANGVLHAAPCDVLAVHMENG